METKNSKPALSGILLSETMSKDQADESLSPKKAAEKSKDVSEICRELILELERGRRIL